MKRTIKEWENILQIRIMAPKDIAERILGDLTHYRHGGGYENQDIENLANALEAFHELRLMAK